MYNRINTYDQYVFAALKHKCLSFICFVLMRKKKYGQCPYPDECSDDLYNSCSCRGVGDLWSWDSRVLKDIVGIEPDL